MFNIDPINKKYKKEQNFILAIIKSGIKEKDLKYFEGEVFRYHCSLLCINSDEIKENIIKNLTEDEKSI